MTAFDKSYTGDEMNRMTAFCAVSLCVIALPAYAQSSVTLYGVLDAGITYVNNQGGAHSLVAQDSNFIPNLWGLRGSEELGDGLKAIFDLQSQFSPDSGAQIPAPGALFDRTATLGLSKDGIGKLTFGTQYNLMADYLLFPPAQVDATLTYGGLFNVRQGPFAGLGIPGNPTGLDFDETGGMTRIPNSVKFRSDPVGGFSFGVLYGFGNQPGSFGANSTVGFGAAYSAGNFRAGAAYNSTRYSGEANGEVGIRNFGAGVGYKFGPLNTSALYTHTRNTLTGGAVQVGQIGGLYYFTPFLRLGMVYQYMSGNAELGNNKASQITTMVQFSLSKRTMLYADAACQWTHGDVPGTYDAWIGGLAPSSTNRQLATHVGIQTFF